MDPLTVFFASLLLAALPQDAEEDDRRWAVDFVRGRALLRGPEFARRMSEPFPDPDQILDKLWDLECLEAKRDPELGRDWCDAYDFLGGQDEELFKKLVSSYPEIGSKGIRELTTYGRSEACRCGPSCSCGEACRCETCRTKYGYTQASSLVTVETPYPTRRKVLLHPAAAASFARVLKNESLTDDDLRALCRINSSFRSWTDQEGLVRQYEAAIRSKWIPWDRLSDAQKHAARAAGFAYHPGNPPVDKPHTHVGGGALDIDSPLPPRAKAALVAEGWKLDSPGDEVHWGWHGSPAIEEQAPEESSWWSWWPFSSGEAAPATPSVPTAHVEVAPGASIELVASDGTTWSTGAVPAGTYDANISGKQKRVTLEAGKTYRASSIGTLYG